MLRTRVIASLTLLNGRVVQSIGFRRYLPIGSLEVAVEFLNQWGADEILIVDITASRRGTGPDLETITPALRRCFVPITVAGGIRSAEDARALVHSGAEKVCLQTAALKDPAVVAHIAEDLGSQAVVVAVDMARREIGEYDVLADNGRRVTGHDPRAFMQDMERLGAGEILATSVERDGSRKGYDLDMVRLAADAVSIPIIAKGGAGHARHMAEAVQVGASAVAAGNMFQHFEHSVTVAKAQLAAHLAVRRDTAATYEGVLFNSDGRVNGHAAPLRPTCNYAIPR